VIVVISASLEVLHPMRCTTPVHLALATLGLAAAGLAQIPALSAHPQETLQNGNGNLVAFGIGETGSCGEGRTMLLVPARELPTTPCVLLGIDVHPQMAATITYSSLAIRCAPTSATTLQSAFASNFGAPPTTVLAASNLTLSWQNGWMPIVFSTPYLHDGSSSLVIEIKKNIQAAGSYPFVTMSTSSFPARTDRPAMIFAFGTPGSGASQASTSAYAANPLSVRLRWLFTPTVRHRSDVGGLFHHQYNLGGTVEVTVAGAPGHIYLLGAGYDWLPARLPIPGLRGALWITTPTGPIVFAQGMLGASGEAMHPISIPPIAALVGMRLTYQAETIDPSTMEITLSNGSDHFINP
jgi:hypothetical protein